MILFNREINFKNIPKALLAGITIVVFISLGVGGFLISQKMRSGSTAPTTSLASEGSNSAKLASGSDNECENNTCLAKPGIGANDCNSDLDCAVVECANVTVEPAKPAVGASNVKFICAGTSNNSNLITAVSFKIETPGSATPAEFLCPSEICTLTPSLNEFTATLTFPEALVRGTYKVMTMTCYNLFSGNKICSDYKSPTI